MSTPWDLTLPVYDTPMMTPTEHKLAASLLRLAADQFSNHGCNDFALRKDARLSDKDARSVVASFNEWDRRKNPIGFEPRPPDIEYMDDWLLMRYLADKLEQETP